MHDAHTKLFVFQWHDPGVHIGITFLSEVKPSIQNPYLGRTHIDFRGYFFPENGCVKKVRTSCLSPAAMLFLWLKRLPAPVSRDLLLLVNASTQVLVSLTLTFRRLFSSFLRISFGDKQTKKQNKTNNKA